MLSFYRDAADWLARLSGMSLPDAQAVVCGIPLTSFVLTVSAVLWVDLFRRK